MLNKILVVIIIVVISSFGCVQGKKAHEYTALTEPVEIESFYLGGDDKPQVTINIPVEVSSNEVADDDIIAVVPSYQEPEPDAPNPYWYQGWYPPPVVPLVVTIYTGSIGITIED